MKKNIAIVILIAAVAFLFGQQIDRTVHAQSGPSVIWSTGTLTAANCGVTFPIPAGDGVICVGSDHFGYAGAGATAFIDLDQPGAANASVQVEIQGTTKTCTAATPCAFTLASASSTLTATATAPAVSGTAAAQAITAK